MPNRNHRPQKANEVANEDTQPLVVHPATQQEDRLHNVKDLDPEIAEHGVEHGGTQESRAQTLNARGSGGRKHR